jgi:hypothetical protein
MTRPITHPDGYRLVEGVRYWPFLLTFRTTDGKRRRRRHWSPGHPWVNGECSRYLQEAVRELYVPGSAHVRQVWP